MLKTLEIKEIPETKAERMEMVINKMIESLPLPARILVMNSITSFLQYSEEGCERVLNVLNELQQFISEGVIPDEEPTEHINK